MNFASEYAYAYDASDSEDFFEEDLDRNITDVSYNEAPRLESTSRRRKVRKADTNIVSVDFKVLGDEIEMQPGEAIKCINCPAILSHLSEITKEENGKKIWACEFCGHKNDFEDHDENEKPTEEKLTYFVGMNKDVNVAVRKNDDKLLDSSLVVFCVDTSGSMGVTTEVSGKIAFKRKSSVFDHQFDAGDSSEQFLPNEKKNVTYVSRLQGVQAAIESQIEDLSKNCPKTRVSLVSFSNEVTVHGDDLATENVKINGKKLNNYDDICEIGKSITTPGMIEHVKEDLVEKIYGLNENGSTALGGGLLASAILASRSPGSSVIVCTDGLANVGVGSFEDDDEKAAEFYAKVGDLCVDKGVAVSVVSIEGTECRMVELGDISRKTKGQVHIVDPLNLAQEFSNILAEPVIATHVTITLVVHKKLYFRLEDDERCDENYNTSKIGNVTKSSEFFVEYGMKPHVKFNIHGDDDEQSEDVVAKSGLPFQLHIEHTLPNGQTFKKIITKKLKVTKDRQKAESAPNAEVVAAHCSRKTATLALKGDYGRAKLNNMSNRRLMQQQSSSFYNKWQQEASEMDQMITSTRQQERSLGTCYSDEEEDEPQSSESRKAKSSYKSKQRRQMTSDKSASTMYKYFK